jgi:integrase
MPADAPSPPPSPPSRARGLKATRTKRADGTVVTYWYCRLTKTSLPPPEHPDHAAALAAARRPQIPRAQPGSLGAILAEWRASSQYRQTAASTQDSRERYLRALDVPAWSGRQVSGLTLDAMGELRADILRLRDAIAETRGVGAASVFGQSIASAFAWAVDRGRLPINPLGRLRGVRLGSIPAWTAEQARHAMTTWPEPLRRAVVLAYWTGIRRGDMTTLRWDQHDRAAGLLLLTPEKTRARRQARGLGPLRIVVATPLAWELTRWRAEAPDATHILTRADGRPWKRGDLSAAIRRRIKAEAWDTRIGLHGLRKLSAAVLAESGAGDAEIAAARGWDTRQQVEGYTRSANQERMARTATDRLEKALSKVGKNRR